MKDIILKKVVLNNFRIHEKYVLDVNKKSVSILGENGSGKTSVLEAIYIAMVGKSFRAVDKEIIKRETGYYRIEVEYTSGEKIVVTYDGNNSKKNFLVQDKKFARLPKKFRYPVVLFLPEDLHLISSSPTSKRDFFDRILVQIDDKYSSSLSRYKKALKQRNEVLKQDNVSRDALFSWDIMLANYGTYIRNRRSELVAEMNQSLTKMYYNIASSNDEVKLKYKSNTGSIDESEYVRLLAMDFERDIATQHTNFGVHRDDYEFMFNGVKAEGSASRGETRSIIIALKFIEAELLFLKNGKKPVVLLDDVFSELDKTRQKCLVDNFKDNQVILTSVSAV